MNCTAADARARTLLKSFLDDILITENCLNQILDVISSLLKKLIGDSDTMEKRNVLLQNVLSGGLLSYGSSYVERELQRLKEEEAPLKLTSEDILVFLGNSGGESVSINEHQYQFLSLTTQYILEDLSEWVRNQTGICGDLRGYRYMKVFADGIHRHEKKNNGCDEDMEEEEEESSESTVPLHYCHFIEFLDDEFKRLFVPVEYLSGKGGDENDDDENKFKAYISDLKARDKECEIYCSELLEKLPLQDIVTCVPRILNLFEITSDRVVIRIELDIDDPDEQDTIDAQKSLLMTMKMTFSSYPSLLAILDEKLAQTFSPASLLKYLSLLNIFTEQDMYPHLYSQLSFLSKEELLMLALQHHNSAVTKYLSRSGYKVIDDNGSPILFKHIGSDSHESEDDNSDDDDGDDDDDSEGEKRKRSTPQGKPIMYYFVKYDCESDILKDLIAMGADINSPAMCPEQYDRHYTQYSSLGQAVDMSRYNAITAFIEAGADLNNVSYLYGMAHDYDNHQEYTPLAIAIEKMNFRAMDMLLAAGADPEYGEYEQLTALSIILCLSGSDYVGYRYNQNGKSLRIVKSLLSHGANAVNGLNMIRYLSGSVDDEIQQIINKTAHWCKNKSFIMFLTMAGLYSNTNSTNEHRNQATGCVEMVFGNKDLVREITSFIPF